MSARLAIAPARRISDAIAAARAEGRAAVIGYLTAGDPSLAATPDLLVAMAEGGADLI